MKRRTSSALPAFYSQIRHIATAAKPNVRRISYKSSSIDLPVQPQPAWDTDSTVVPPAPNLSKWSVPTQRIPSVASLSCSPNAALAPAGTGWDQRGTQSNPVGKWARTEAPQSRSDDTQAPSSSSSSRIDRYLLRKDPGQSTADRWTQQIDRKPLLSSLSKWARGETSHTQHDDTQTSSLSSRHNLSASRINPRSPAADRQVQQTVRKPAPSSLSKWAKVEGPHTRHDCAQLPPQSTEPLPSSSSNLAREGPHILQNNIQLPSESSRLGRNQFPHRRDPPHTGPSPPSPIGRWARQDEVPHQQQHEESPSTWSANRNWMQNRDAAPHRAGALQPPRNSRAADQQRSRWGNTSTVLRNFKGEVSNVQAREDNPTAAGDKVDDELYENYIPTDESIDSGRNRRLNRDRGSYKTRGSISSQLRGQEATIPAHSRGVNDRLRSRTEKDRVHNAKKPKKVNMDVFIPSTVSVGQLARLLNVRMSRCHFNIYYKPRHIDVLGLHRVAAEQDGKRRNDRRICI
jgi:hypothetical protein